MKILIQLQGFKVFYKSRNFMKQILNLFVGTFM